MDELDEILEIIKEGKCIPFIGAGVSNVAGCSNWNSIPTELESMSEIKNAKSNNANLVPPGSSREQKIDIYLNELKKLNKAHLYTQVIEKAINCDIDKVKDDYAKIIKAIEKIYLPSRILMTTNVDNCLDLVKNTNFVPGSARKYFKEEEFDIRNLSSGGIFHIHGHRNHLDGTVFTDGAILTRYKNIGFTNFLCHVFKTYSLLFIGYGLEDSSLMEIIERMKDRKHYALVRKQDKYTPEKKTEMLEKYNIRLVEYSEHSELPKKLQEWTDVKFPDASVKNPEEEGVKNAG